MELTYSSQSNSKPGVTLIGIFSIGISLLLLCVPPLAMIVSHWVVSSLNSEEMLRRISYGRVELAQIFNATLLTLSLAGLLLACVGSLLSRTKCLASVAAAIFNLVIVLLIATRNF
jgi:hypothetical protein